jgi:hypothetical protein
MLVAPLSRAAEYRRQAQQAREVAAWIYIHETRQQLLETARHLETLAEDEERRAREMMPPHSNRSIT